MHYYYDKNGEVILDVSQELYYKMGLMREDSKHDYEVANNLVDNSSQEETSKLKKIIDDNNSSNKENN